MLIDWYAKKSFLNNFNYCKRKRVAKCKDISGFFYYERLWVDWQHRLFYWQHGSDFATEITAQVFRCYSEPVYFESEV